MSFAETKRLTSAGAKAMLAAAIAKGYLEARVSRVFPLESVVAAFNASFAGGAVGKLGIRVREEPGR